MRIAVLNVAASTSGALSVLKDFYEYVKKNSGGHEWVFFVSTPRLDECQQIKVINVPWIKKSWLHRLWWDCILARYTIASVKPDLVLSLQNTIVHGLSLPQILYIHQALPFQSVKKFSFLKADERMLAVYQHIISPLIIKSAKQASAIVVQTRWMKEALARRLGDHRKKIYIVKPEIAPIESVLIHPTDYQRHVNFFYPATPVKYKNHECIIEAAYKLLNKGIDGFVISFTFYGNENAYAKRIYRMAKGLGDRIRFEGYFARSDVLSRYRKSVLLFPSYIETYGLPLLEARMLGGLVLASDCPFSREILEGYCNARFFDPFDSEALAALMETVVKRNFVINQSSHDSIPVGLRGWGEVVRIVEETTSNNR